MSYALNLPAHELFVSTIEIRDTLLSVRLVGDYHPGANPQVYVVLFESPSSPEEAAGFLGVCRDEGRPVYLAEEEGVAFTTESGVAIESEHSGFPRRKPRSTRKN